jgi:hypothetical protein
MGILGISAKHCILLEAEYSIRGEWEKMVGTNEVHWHENFYSKEVK